MGHGRPLSVVRFTDSFNHFIAGPSDKSLGYFQSSADADSGTLLFVQSAPSFNSKSAAEVNLNFLISSTTSGVLRVLPAHRRQLVRLVQMHQSGLRIRLPTWPRFPERSRRQDCPRADLSTMPFRQARVFQSRFEWLQGSWANH